MNDHRMGWPPLAAMIAEAFPRPAARMPIGTPRDPVDQAARAALDVEPMAEAMFPEGVWERGPGKYMATCCRCERDTELLVGLDEIPAAGYEHYCYGSDRCCP